MRNLNIPLDDEIFERKEDLQRDKKTRKKITWPQVVERGVKSFELAEKKIK